MIDDLRELIRANWSVFPASGACDTAALSFTKFCQRIVQMHTKVLYFVTYRGKPFCIVKTVRSHEFNENLKREKCAQEAARPVGRVRAPKVFFDGMLGGRYMYAEEVVVGRTVSRVAYARSAKALSAFICQLPARGSITAKELAELLKQHVPSGLLERELSVLFGSDEVLSLGLTHGDLGRPNVISSRGGLVVIDWERAGDIPLACIDGVALGTERSPVLGAAHTIYTVLYKKYPDRYRTLVKEFHFV